MQCTTHLSSTEGYELNQITSKSDATEPKFISRVIVKMTNLMHEMSIDICCYQAPKRPKKRPEFTMGLFALGKSSNSDTLSVLAGRPFFPFVPGLPGEPGVRIPITSATQESSDEYDIILYVLISEMMNVMFLVSGSKAMKQCMDNFYR